VKSGKEYKVKQYARKAVSFLLTLVMLLPGALPAAANTNTQGVTYTAVLEEPTVQAGETGKTVRMTIGTSQPLELLGFSYTVVYDSSVLTLDTIEGSGDINLSEESDLNRENHFVSWFKENLKPVSTSTLGTVVFTVNENAAPGSYEVGMTGLKIADKDRGKFETDGSATATLKVVNPDVADAEYTAYLGTPSAEKAEPGEDFTVPLMISGSQALAGAQLDLSCNSDVAKIKEIALAEGLTEKLNTVKADGSSAKLTFYGSGLEAAQSPWQIATVTMTAVKEGTSKLSVDDGAVAAREGQTLEYPLTAGAPVEVEVVKPLDTTALEQAINDAQQKLEPVQESADGKDIEKTDQWATPAERTALSNAIAAAQAVLAAAPEKTQDEIDDAVKTLNDAAAAFRPQPGLKEDEPQHVHQYESNGFCNYTCL
jgi:hypothetical protein